MAAFPTGKTKVIRLKHMCIDDNIVVVVVVVVVAFSSSDDLARILATIVLGHSFVATTSSIIIISGRGRQYQFFWISYQKNEILSSVYHFF
jgi:hypothetical protein